MKKLVLDIPDYIELDENEALAIIAARLFDKGDLSLGQAAELAGVTKHQFIGLIGSLGINFISYPEEELQSDFKNAGIYSR